MYDFSKNCIAGWYDIGLEVTCSCLPDPWADSCQDTWKAEPRARRHARSTRRGAPQSPVFVYFPPKAWHKQKALVQTMATGLRRLWTAFEGSIPPSPPKCVSLCVTLQPLQKAFSELFCSFVFFGHRTSESSNNRRLKGLPFLSTGVISSDKSHCVLFEYCYADGIDI